MRRRGLLAGGLLPALSLLPSWTVQAQPLSLGEQFALRARTGAALGHSLAEVLGLSHLGLLVNGTSICAALASATGAAFLDRWPGGSLRVEALAAAEEAASAVHALRGQEGVGLLFGGQAGHRENLPLVRASLQALQAEDYRGTVFLHLRLWLAGQLTQLAQEDAALADWLAVHPRLVALSVDPKHDRYELLRVGLDDGRQVVRERLEQRTMDPSWARLFRRLFDPEAPA